MQYGPKSSDVSSIRLQKEILGDFDLDASIVGTAQEKSHAHAHHGRIRWTSIIAFA